MRKSKQITADRLCRLDGQRPNSRDRWLAFHRLYRLAHRGDMHHELDASECFRVLMPDWRPIQLLEDGRPEIGSEHRAGLPVFLRRKFVGMERRRRLAGDRNGTG